MISALAAEDAGDDVLDLWNRWERELPPGERAIGLRELRSRFLHPGGARDRHDWFVERDHAGTARGLAHLERWFMAENRELAECEILVDPECRRRGVGRRLLRHLLDRASADQRTSLIAWGPRTAACTAFWEHFGLERRYDERISRCDLTTTDAELMQQWVDAARTRAADYELVFWRGLCPPELLERYAEAETAVNDAPIDELEMDGYHFDAAYMAERDALLLESGLEPWVYLALHRDSGRVAGVTEVFVNGHDPAYSEQWSTVVLAEHRRRGLGRLLKASMFLRLRRERPDVRYLDTGNAHSNEAMLAINVAMGFRPHRDYACWQGDIASIAARAA